MTPTDHAELARLAEAATAGEWRAADWDAHDGENLWTVEAREPEVLSPGQSSIWPDGVRCKRVAQTEEGESPTEDAAFIAAANPARVLALLAEIAALRVDLSRKHDACQIAQDQVMENGFRAIQAERQRDEARKVIRELIEPYEPFDDVQLFQVVNNGLATRITSARTFLDSLTADHVSDLRQMVSPPPAGEE